MCEECEVKQARIDELESALMDIQSRSTNILKGKKKTRAKATSINWTDKMTPVQASDKNFIQAWSTFLANRAELKKPLTSHAGQTILRGLAVEPIEFQAKCLYTSVNKGWLGCNPDWVKKIDGQSEGNNVGGKTPPSCYEVSLDDL